MTNTEINNIAKETATELRKRGYFHWDTEVAFLILESGKAEKHGFDKLVAKYKTVDNIIYNMLDTDALQIASYYSKFVMG